MIPPRISSACCRTLSALSPKLVQLRGNTVPPPPPLTEYNSPRTIRKLLPMTEEVKGQSGRRYSIERVLQDKGVPMGCVYLATYVLPELCCLRPNADLSMPAQRWNYKGCVEGDSSRLQHTCRYIWPRGQLSSCPRTVRHSSGTADVCLRVSQ